MFVLLLSTISGRENKLSVYPDLTQNLGSFLPDINPCVVSISKNP